MNRSTLLNSPAASSVRTLSKASLLALALASLSAHLVAAEKPAPLPLHQIEGSGGIFSTLSAYIVNPPRDNEPLGRPSVGLAYVDLGHGRTLGAATVTETPWRRLEFGYAFDSFDLGDLPQAIDAATGIKLRDDKVELQVLSARLQLLEETDTLPAVTAGIHFKSNDGIDRINADLGGLLRTHGIEKDSGTDFTLYASKLFKTTPVPVLVNAGLRATKGAHLGLLGFTDDLEVVFEGNVVLFLTGQFALAAEYKQKPNAYQPVGALVKAENDWWTLDAAYVVNKHLTLAAGYGHFGSVLNHTANGVWGITTKFEF